jgi:hypothetical protein
MRRRGRDEVCAATGCCTVVQRGHLMCHSHWLALPAAIRKSIIFSHRNRWVRDYQNYVREAVDHLEAAEQRFTGIFEPRASAPRVEVALGRGQVSRPAFVVPADGGVAI